MIYINTYFYEYNTYKNKKRKLFMSINCLSVSYLSPTVNYVAMLKYKKDKREQDAFDSDGK